MVKTKHLRTLYGDDRNLKVTFYKTGMFYEVRSFQYVKKRWLQKRRYISNNYDKALKIFQKYYDEF